MSDEDLFADNSQTAGPLARCLRLVITVTAGTLLLTLMGLTVCDVIGRYALNAPVKGAAELSELLLVATVFIGLPAVCLDGGHVTVDLITKNMPRITEAPRLFITGVISTVVLVIVSWRLWAYGTQVAGYNLVTNNLRLPVAPVVWFCSVFTAIAAAITLVLAVMALTKRNT